MKSEEHSITIESRLLTLTRVSENTFKLTIEGVAIDNCGVVDLPITGTLNVQLTLALLNGKMLVITN